MYHHSFIWFFPLYQRNSLLFHLENSRSAFHWMRSRRSNEFNEAGCALRIHDKCNICRACWFIALTFFRPRKKNDGKIAHVSNQAHQSKSKTKPNWIAKNQYKQTKSTKCHCKWRMKSFFFLRSFGWGKDEKDVAHTHTYTWLAVRSFNASAIDGNFCGLWCNLNRVVRGTQGPEKGENGHN